MLLTPISEAIWFILPSYLANTFPIFVKKINLLVYPVDFRISINNKRIFGDNKTWRGIIFGTSAGVLTSVLQERGVFVGLVLGLGALLGDLLGSFVKRRINFLPGQPSLILDQIPYVVVPLLLYSIFFDYPLSLGQSFFIILISIVLHRLSNIIYYKLGIKEVPY